MIYFQSLCYQWHKLAFFLLLCYDFGSEVIDMLKSTNLKRRDTYLNKLIGFQDTEPVKVITGIRRCGKSSLLKLMISHLIETGIQEDQILEMNFESFDFRKMSSEEVYNYVQTHKAVGKKMYLFFDELQRIPSWEDAINAFRVDLDCDIYITGSNAFLLSSDLATLFTGRTMEIKVYPFSFVEYLTYYGITDRYDEAFDQYVRTGGMPGSYVYKTEDRQYDYVRDVYSTILIRDLVEKYKIRNKSEFTNISEFMMDNIGNLLSPNNISKTLKNDQSEITRKTVSKYIGYLENA